MIEQFNEPRLSLSWTENNILPGDQEKIVDCYQQWVNQPLYYILKKHSDFEDQQEFIALRARKRGDNKYERETTLRFKAVVDNIKGINVRTGRKDTGALLISCTYQDNTPANWKRISGDWNLFISRVRKRYGKCHCVRIWEAHQSGLPHLHALLLFAEHSFPSFVFRSKVRIEDKDEFAALWPHGFTDVQGVYNAKGAIGYLAKYLKKMLKLELKGSTITLAMLWFHRKRMYGISKYISDLIPHKRNSNSETWSFVGICASHVDLEIMWIEFAEKTEKGMVVLWQTSKQMSLIQR